MPLTTPSHERTIQTNHKRKSSGLKRPKRPLSFQISTSRIESGDLPSKDPSTPPSPEDALEKRILLVNLLVRRNKNQHRGQIFYKHLCLLRSSLVRLQRIVSRLSKLAHSAGSTTTSEQVRRNFEIEATLRSQKDVLEEHLREVLVPQCYVSFSGLVGDSQFGNLGVMLVALLSEIACGWEGFGAVRDVQSEDQVNYERTSERGREEGDVPLNWSGSLLGTSTRVTGEDKGEVVERVYDRNAVGTEDANVSEIDETVQAAEEDGDIDLQTSKKRIRQGRSSAVPSHYRSAGLTKIGSKMTGPDSSAAGKKNQTGEGDAGKKKKPKTAIDDLFSGLL